MAWPRTTFIIFIIIIIFTIIIAVSIIILFIIILIVIIIIIIIICNVIIGIVITSLAPDRTLTRPRRTFLPTAKLSPAPLLHISLLLLLLHLQPPKLIPPAVSLTPASDCSQFCISTIWSQSISTTCKTLSYANYIIAPASTLQILQPPKLNLSAVSVPAHSSNRAQNCKHSPTYMSSSYCIFGTFTCFPTFCAIFLKRKKLSTSANCRRGLSLAVTFFTLITFQQTFQWSKFWSPRASLELILWLFVQFHFLMHLHRVAEWLFGLEII